MPEPPTIKQLNERYNNLKRASQDYQKKFGEPYKKGQQVVDDAVNELSSTNTSFDYHSVEEQLLNTTASNHKQLLKKLYSGPLKEYRLRNGHKLQLPPYDYKTPQTLGVLLQSCLTRANYLFTMLNLSQRLREEQPELNRFDTATRTELNRVLNDCRYISQQITNFLDPKQKPQFSAVKYDFAREELHKRAQEKLRNGNNSSSATFELEYLNQLLQDYINQVRWYRINSYYNAAQNAVDSKADDTTNGNNDLTTTKYQPSDDNNVKIHSMLSKLKDGVKQRDNTDYIKSNNSRLYSYLTAFWQENQEQLDVQAQKTTRQLLGIN